MIYIGIFAVFMNVIIPSEKTVYMIAASEIGERVVNIIQVQGIVDPSMELLRAWIQTETERLRGQINNNRQ